MLQLQQVKDLLTAGLSVFHTRGSQCAICLNADGVPMRGYFTGPGHDDVDWEELELGYVPADYAVLQHASFGSFHTIHVHPGFQTNTVRLVKFQNQAPSPHWGLPMYDYILVTSSDPNMTPETATEAAIDHLLAKGWDEVQAQPLLVI